MTYEFNDEIRAFLQEKLYLQNVSPRTIILYESCFKAFDGATENLDVVKDRVVQLRSRGVSPVTVNTYLRHIKCFYRWKGMEWKLPWLKEEQKILPTFNAQQVQGVLNSRPKTKNEFRLHALLCLLLDSGLRISEALSLTKDDVNWDSLTIKVRGKGNKHRLVPISQELRKVLFRYLHTIGRTQSIPGQTLLFATKHHTKLTVRNFLRDFKKLGERLRIKDVRISPHTLRHTFAVNYLRRGGNLEFLRRILGHSSILTTQKYLKSLGVEDLQAVHSGLSLLGNAAN